MIRIINGSGQLKLAEKAFSEMKDKFLVGMTDLGGISDIASSLRGASNLLFDLVDNPDKVKVMQEQILELWFKYFNELRDLSKGRMDGMSAWMGIWSKKDWYPIQCDFSAMISPAMFKEFVLPHLREQCRKLPRTVYHLDGPGEVPHLDMLLSIKELTAIQWTPGDGKALASDFVWFPMFKKIQEAGKRIVILWVPPETVEPMIKNLDPRGILIKTHCKTEEEADELVKLTAKWTMERLKQLK